MSGDAASPVPGVEPEAGSSAISVSPLRDGWIEHRRQDGELVGWMRPSGDGFVPVDLLGRSRAGAVDWLEAEELLDDLGIGYLADAYLLQDAHLLGPGSEGMRVRIVEVSTARILVKKDDFGDMRAPVREFALSWPLPETLRPMTRDELRDWEPATFGQNEDPALTTEEPA
ncbi:hypothetical protein [Herbiconiux liukaitaii]|uniref:hypothetical protein n=1 Tax=Herbiconiux liukaitaii TaxID=3342799 RepID=UPI0035BAD942